MNEVLKAFGRALRDVWHPKMLALAILPIFAALAIWAGLAWWYWDTWTQWLSTGIAGSAISQWLPLHTLEVLAQYSARLLLMFVLAPMILITAALLAALVEMPVIVGFVAAHGYPALEGKHGGTVPGSIVNALVAVSVFIGLWVITLPLWLTGVMVPVLPVVLSAYLNQRLFRYDALSEHASAEEYVAIVKTNRGRMYGLGALTGLLYFVPLLNLFAPVLSGLSFTHFCLAGLSRLRRAGESRPL